MDSMSAKHEWRKAEKTLYLPKTVPALIEVPDLGYVTISGAGDPNGGEFAERIRALYPIVYGLKMTAKRKGKAPAGHYDYTVYPLEGIWDVNDEVKRRADGRFSKDELVYKLMIRQPDFIGEAFFREIVAAAKVRDPNPLFDEVKFERMAEGRCVQMLHVGSFDTEPASFAKMERFAEGQGLRRRSKIHREIYLSDFRKTAVEKLKTVLRFQVE